MVGKKKKSRTQLTEADVKATDLRLILLNILRAAPGGETSGPTSNAEESEEHSGIMGGRQPNKHTGARTLRWAGRTSCCLLRRFLLFSLLFSFLQTGQHLFSLSERRVCSAAGKRKAARFISSRDTEIGEQNVNMPNANFPRGKSGLVETRCQNTFKHALRRNAQRQEGKRNKLDSWEGNGEEVKAACSCTSRTDGGTHAQKLHQSFKGSVTGRVGMITCDSGEIRVNMRPLLPCMLTFLQRQQRSVAAP